MITDHLLGDGLVPFIAWTVLCWMLGVGWAAYRAVGWVDRIRAWAHTAPIETEESCAPSDS